MKELRRFFMASVLTLGLLGACSALAVGVNNQGGANAAANQVRDPCSIPPQANMLNGTTAMHPELLAGPNCPPKKGFFGTVPWVMGTW